MGCKPSRVATPAFRRREIGFWPSGTNRWDPRVYGTRRRSVRSPPHSLRSCSGPAGFRPTLRNAGSGKSDRGIAKHGTHRTQVAALRHHRAQPTNDQISTTVSRGSAALQP
jgi:hypothetical protein